MKVISLGWGVQSFALAAMSALGVLPKVDAAIHADTGHERAETYALAKKWTPWLEERGIKVITVGATDTQPIRQWARAPTVMIAAHSAYSHDVWAEGGDYDTDKNGEEFWIPDGSRYLAHKKGESSGMTRRQCTREWKIRPIKRWLQANRNKQHVQQWIGITLDEVTRMRIGDVKYQQLHYPFIEDLGRPWTRGMVMHWLRDNNLEIPVKSSCAFCPYHDRATWREIQQGNTGDWERAIAVDEAIRDAMPRYTCYLTAARKPLVDCDFRSQEDHGQLTLWDEECSGMCFL